MLAAPLRYTLLVTGPPYGTQQASSAYQFAQACIAAGHRLIGIFFYHEGVLNANQFTAPASDEFDLVDAWQQLAQQAKVVLWVCSAAAQRRGVIDTHESAIRKLKGANLALEFDLVGLTTLAEMITASDRVLQF